MSRTEAIVVLITTVDQKEASLIAEHLVEARLAPCVQILPGIESVYRWKGAIERNAEVLLLAKTTADKFDELEVAVCSLHSYETPEIVALPVAAVSEAYLEWLVANVGTEN